MNKDMICKTLALGVIILFIGVGVQPALAIVKQESIDYEYYKEYTPLEVNIIKPENGIYCNNQKILPFFVPLILCGSISIMTEIEGGSGIDMIEFYINGLLQHVVSGGGPHYEYCFSWYPFSKINVKIIVYTINESASDEITIWRIFK